MATQVLLLQNKALVGEPQREFVAHEAPAAWTAQDPLVQVFDAHSSLTEHEAPAFLNLIAHLLAEQNWL